MLENATLQNLFIFELTKNKNTPNFPIPLNFLQLTKLNSTHKIEHQNHVPITTQVPISTKYLYLLKYQ